MEIAVRGVGKTFGGGFAALRDVSLSVKDGELVALLGPSGSGKTTLLRIIAGLDLPSGGAVFFNGEDVTGIDVGRRGVGFVFQHYALFRHMTVFDNIAFGLRVKPRRSRPSKAAVAARVNELLQLIHMDGLAGRYPSQLSGGQRQRVALARALAIEPKVLLLDEPFGALDAKVRQSLRRWLRKLHEEMHIITILVTHDQEEALEVADRIVLMNQGRIEQDGTPEAVFHQPASEFVMDFLGSVNLFHGRIEQGKAVFGPLALDQPGALKDGSAARLFVRPHDLEIHGDGNGRSGLHAKVVRVQSAGPQVKVELVSQDGEPVLVEMSHGRFREAPVAAGDHVFVSVRDARIFLDDYVI